MNSNELRKKFIDYFVSLGHKHFPSDSLIPSSDPSLLFTTAGMVQFKDYFLGKKTGLTRACSVQKCLRTSDIEKVGHTIRHLTFFEMLGNFSFGDYFKKEAIEWAWEFITKVVNLEVDRLYITVYKDDDEAYDLWSKIVKKDRIYKLSEETNFWQMGDTGPCGPCSEIIYDLGKEFGCGKPTCDVTCDCNRFLEVWNLVFTQFDRQPDGKLIPLKQKNIDTGMGLERLNLVVNGLKNVFETDLFQPIISEFLKNFDVDYNNKQNQPYIHAITDHVRAATFAISEGVIPSTEGRGYVIRKIIRRAVRYLKLLGCNQSFLYKLVPIVIKIMKDTYPELELHREKVAIIIKTEEEKFLETLDEGLKIINEIINSNKKQVSGELVFKLYDTYGFPKELVDEIFKEANIIYNEKEFLEAEEKAKEISRASWKGVKVVDTYIYTSFPQTNFVGYTQFSCKAKLLGIIKDKEKLNSITKTTDTVELIFDQTPFYGESGGQIGDTGEIFVNKKLVAKVLDTKKIEGRIVHISKVYEELKTNDEVELKIDIDRRKDIMRHHTATHLLHKALKETLGEHAVQSGSLVSDEYFRFDFVHWEKLTKEQLKKIEEIVNQKILECLPVNIFYTTLDKAKQLGATALFEEKYGQEVRVVAIGHEPSYYSIELCGGTHCSNTGEIGIFKIISESSVGTNLRRIEAICGRKVYKYITELESKINSIGEILEVNTLDEIKTKLEKLLQQNKKLQQEIENIKTKFFVQKGEEIEKEINGIKLIVKHIPSTELKILRSLSDEIIKNYNNIPAILLLYSLENKKISLVLRTNDIAMNKGVNLKQIAEKINNVLKIKCGGREDFLQGGGNIEKNITPNDFIEILL
jgi:alanyl-tRNA synthetase